MRVISLFLQCAVLASSVSAQTTEVFSSFFGITNSVQWFKHALDASGSGDIVVTGFTDGTMGVPGAGQNPALSSGSNDWFVARYNALGNLLWFRKIGGAQSDLGTTITTDGQGNTYVGGSSNSNLDVGVNTNNWDPFVAKYDINGTKQWIKNLASSLSATGRADDETGIAQLVLDGNSIFTVSTTYSNRLTVSRWDREFTTMQWKNVMQFNSPGSSNSPQTLGVADATVDSNHNLIVVGARQHSHIEPPTPRVPRAVGQGGWDGFTLGFSATGEYTMIAGQGTPGEDMTLGVTVDANNNIYVTGYVSGNYDGESWRNHPWGYGDVFITKYAPITASGQGERLWSRVFFPSASNDNNAFLKGVRLAVDYVGGLYVAAVEQSLQYSSNAVGYFNTPGRKLVALQKFDTNGNSVWGQRLEMANMNVAGFSFDNTGSLYISGSFNGNGNNGNWNGQKIGDAAMFGYLQKRSNPLNCSCSDLSTLVDEVASLLQISVN